jgi:hypothetical protein
MPAPRHLARVGVAPGQQAAVKGLGHGGRVTAGAGQGPSRFRGR